MEIIEGSAPFCDGELVVDGHGLVALPGMIDLHGDMLEREIEPRPGARFPVDMALLELDKRLAAAGVTTAYAAISFHEGANRTSLRNAERAQSIAVAIDTLRDQLLIDMRVHARFEITHPQVVPILADLLQAGQVQLVSLTDHTPGQGQYRDIEAFIDRMAEYRKVSREEIAANTHARLLQSEPPSWEIVREITRLAQGGGVLIASHDDDTHAKVELVHGLGATICEFPVSLEAAEAARSRGMHVVMGAPNALRGGSHSGNLSALEAIEAGLVDVLAADYYPGALLFAVFHLAQRGILPLHAASRLVSQNPATALGLTECGALVVGNMADIMLVEPGYSPRVRGTLRAGAPIYWDSFLASRVRQPSTVSLAS
ncbi:MAG: Alpha-D-ribose 1-methylphosphonate 5-triphosphate diphosphatase PhnM [uncultured Chloroflexia bacterium]|uniref:Alpha-D-ribose 1-methylphosphonate 5-triphosphate diphosphatase PhnM n=1 Tax=uncultured Chloroflexia bacterium TaxID=1672391 RepID=A0A6J4IKW6_9CHLR|nr:MAG: Alpha-D-ribose 1-methylphosphonate 5-triphosphate diphosphatase PhnM [uncultured Chloroflexia bacterium]